MKMIKLVLGFFLVSLFLVGCFNIEEEEWVCSYSPSMPFANEHISSVTLRFGNGVMHTAVGTARSLALGDKLYNRFNYSTSFNTLTIRDDNGVEYKFKIKKKTGGGIRSIDIIPVAGTVRFPFPLEGRYWRRR